MCGSHNNESMREKKVSAVPFGGVEAQAEEGEREFHEPLGACGGFACDRHGEVAECEEVMGGGLRGEKTRKVTVF